MGPSCKVSSRLTAEWVPTSDENDQKPDFSCLGVERSSPQLKQRSALDRSRRPRNHTRRWWTAGDFS